LEQLLAKHEGSFFKALQRLHHDFAEIAYAIARFGYAHGEVQIGNNQLIEHIMILG